jgi:hypothetical protein
MASGLDQEEHTVTEKEKPAERENRQSLEALLEPGEELLAHTSGFLFDRPYQHYAIGLTPKRLILLRKRKAKKGGAPRPEVYSLLRRSIRSAGRETTNKGAVLKFNLPADHDELEFSFPGPGDKAMADRVNTDRYSDAMPTAQDMLEQARVFKSLGFPASTERALNKALELDPALSTHPEVTGLKEQAVEDRLALRVAAWFIWIGLAIVALMIIGSGAGFMEVVLALAGGVVAGAALALPLWRAQRQDRAMILIRAGIPLVVFTVILVRYHAVLPFVIAAAVDGAMILVLTGRSSRAKTLAAIGLYAIGLIAFGIYAFSGR